jgi:hypothetical protein
MSGFASFTAPVLIAASDSRNGITPCGYVAICTGTTSAGIVGCHFPRRSTVCSTRYLLNHPALLTT